MSGLHGQDHRSKINPNLCVHQIVLKHWHFDSRQLLHINTVCTTPEKMAIVLLDHLFSQETQAESNLSGKGKHFKKQLDPLKVHHNNIKTVYLITGSSSEMGRFSYCITGT